MNAQTIGPPPAANQQCRSGAPEFAVAFNLETVGTLALAGHVSPLALIIKTDIERALAERGLLLPPNSVGPLLPAVLNQLSFVAGIFFVSNWQRAVATLEAELQRIGLLADAEIGWFCSEELIWRRYSKNPGEGTFKPLILSWNNLPVTPKLTATTALLLKVMAEVNRALAETAAMRPAKP